jgi:hypothetical protein
MKKISATLMLILLICSTTLNSQTTTAKATDSVTKKPLFGIAFSGYVKTDIIYDTPC